MMNTQNKEIRNGKISCEVIRDLMPSYIDGLASESTEKLIEEHIKDCAECRAMLQNMRADGVEEQNLNDDDRKEIDFLKKNRKKNKRAVILGIILALMVAAAAAGAKVYMIGSDYYGDLGCDVKVDGNTMTVGVTAADSMHVVRGVDFTMKDGVAVGTVRAVMPGIYHSSGTSADGTVVCDWMSDYSFSEEIKEVRIGDRIYWADGRGVSGKVSEVFMAGHDYIGDVSENGALLTALDITEDMGSLYSELETEKEPYIWKIILDDDQAKYNTEYLESHLKGYGYILIGTVGNLSEVDFKYTSGGENKVLRVTAEDASDFFGKDIKTCRTNAGALSELMEKTDIR